MASKTPEPQRTYRKRLTMRPIRKFGSAAECETDWAPARGYTLHHELELYASAGIPAPEVLRIATLTSAQVMNVTKDLGLIAPGKLADMILVDGDPTKNIRDIRNITTVLKGGKIYAPAAIEKALGIAPRPPRR